MTKFSIARANTVYHHLRPVTRSAAKFLHTPLQKFFLPLDKYVGYSVKLLNTV